MNSCTPVKVSDEYLSDPLAVVLVQTLAVAFPERFQQGLVHLMPSLEISQWLSLLKYRLLAQKVQKQQTSSTLVLAQMTVSLIASEYGPQHLGIPSSVLVSSVPEAVEDDVQEVPLAARLPSVAGSTVALTDPCP